LSESELFSREDQVAPVATVV